jgi:hypothetical protein
MNHKTGIATLICALAVAAAVGWWIASNDEVGEPKSVENEVAKGPMSKQANPKPKLSPTLDARSAPTTSTPESPGTARKLPKATLVEVVNDLMQDPQLNSLIEAQISREVGAEYDPLIQELNFSPQQDAHFRELLIDKSTQLSKLELAMLKPGLSDSQFDGLRAKYARVKSESDDKLRTFLNDDTDYEKLKTWERTEFERMLYSVGKMKFDKAGIPLSIEQQQKLTEVMADVRTKPGSLPDFTDPLVFDPRALSENMIKLYENKLEKDAVMIGQQAEKFLTAEQIAILTNFLREFRPTILVGLQLARNSDR